MKEIKANRIQKGIDALTNKDFKSMTLSQSDGTSAFKTESTRPSLDFQITVSPVVKIALVCKNEEAQAAIALIIANGKTDGPGDGIIYVANIADAFKIKTGTSLKQYNE